MKILFTGGGSGGHFYPIIAIAQEINKITKEQKLVGAELFFMSNSPYNKRALFENQIKFKKASAGKKRLYFSFKNFFDIFKMFFGVLAAFWKVFLLFPDVVVGKGGYASFPALLAARILRIPVLIHESDSVPGRVNKWAGKFAKRIAVSWPEAAKHFPQGKVALTGNPIRASVRNKAKSGARDFFKLHEELPVIFVTGGSQGAQKINDVVVDALPVLTEKYQVIHQTGKNNLKDVNARVETILNDKQKLRYRSLSYLDEIKTAYAAGLAKLVVSRAGSTIFEIANWGVPSIVIPITESNGDHQRKNAFTYSKSGAATLLQEANLKDSILISEIDRILQNEDLWQQMSNKALGFAKPEAARTIAQEVLNLALRHEK